MDLARTKGRVRPDKGKLMIDIWGAHPVYETRNGDVAINMWATEDLLLDRLEREIPGLPDASPPYFEVSNEFEASRENLNLYDESPRHVVRGSAVYPRTGVLIREASSALRSGGR